MQKLSTDLLIYHVFPMLDLQELGVVICVNSELKTLFAEYDAKILKLSWSNPSLKIFPTFRCFNCKHMSFYRKTVTLMSDIHEKFHIECRQYSPWNIALGRATTFEIPSFGDLYTPVNLVIGLPNTAIGDLHFPLIGGNENIAMGRSSVNS
jgi:hypothetical protein